VPCLFPLVSNYRTASPTATSLAVLTPGQTRQLTAPAHDWLTTSDRTCPHPTSNFVIWPRISTGIHSSRPALLGHSIQTLELLRTISLPPSWSGDPILWNEAEATPLLNRLEQRRGLLVPFSAEFWPSLRIVDPAKPARGKRRTPGLREVDIARHVRASQPDLDRPAAYATWLATQLPGARIDPSEVRLAAEKTVPAATGSFEVISVRLVGRLHADDPTTLGSALLRGVGRRRAYGLGLVAVG
jgi:hypothetical protein